MLQNDRLPPFHFDADPDPVSQNDADSCESGSATFSLESVSKTFLKNHNRKVKAIGANKFHGEPFCKTAQIPWNVKITGWELAENLVLCFVLFVANYYLRAFIFSMFVTSQLSCA
jgi:hypothetical protein